MNDHILTLSMAVEALRQLGGMFDNSSTSIPTQPSAPPETPSTVTPMVPYRQHICSICGESFERKNDLGNHIVCHQVDRPHACRYSFYYMFILFVSLKFFFLSFPYYSLFFNALLFPLFSTYSYFAYSFFILSQHAAYYGWCCFNSQYGGGIFSLCMEKVFIQHCEKLSSY